MRLSNIAIYDKSTIDFYNQGLGILSDAISSESTEAVQDNGNITYEMTLKYPINGVLADKLKLPNLIRAQESEDPNDFMIFEIYDYDEDDDGEMTVYAQALPYRVLRLPFNDEAKFATKYNDVQELFDDAIKRVTGFPTWFKINSDVKLASNLNFKDSQFENLGKLLEATMSLIDASVEYQWNRINILDSRGRDLSDIVLRDDKNTNGVKITGSYEKIVNKVVPIIRNRNDKTGEFENGTHMGSVVTSKDPFKWIPYYAGVTAAFDSQEEANNYISSNKLDNPAITVDVTPLMVDEDLTQVHTFDRITAYSTKLKYQDTLQVTTRVFDQLNAEVVSFKMGSIKKDINSTTSYTLSSLASEIARAQNIARGAARSADGKNTNYYAEATPADPIEGDLWFHKIDGKDIIQQYINGEWTTIVKDGMGEEIQAYVDQKMLENDEVLAGLNTKLQDNDKALAGLNTKLQDNDDAMDKLHTDLKSNAQTIKDNKQAVDDAMGKVNENLTQAKSDAAQAVKHVDQAVANAKSSADASGLATQTANAASDAALAAKNLATSTANSFEEVKSQSAKAASNAATALNKAKDAVGNASDALSKAKSALSTANSVQTGMQPAIATAVDKAKGELTASIKTVQNGLSNLKVGATNLVSNSSFEHTPVAGAGGKLVPKITGQINTYPAPLFGDKYLHVYHNPDDDADFYTVYDLSKTFKLLANRSYVFSYYFAVSSGLDGQKASDYLVATDGTNLTLGMQGHDQLVKVSDSSGVPEWQRFIRVYTPTQDYEIKGVRLGYLVTDTSKAYWRIFDGIQIEEGTIVTSWAPAPEDFADASSLTGLSNTVVTNTTNITANSKEIALAAKQTTVNDLTKQVTTNTAQLKLTATEADLKLATNAVDALTGRVTTAEGKITATSEALKAVYTKSETTNLLGGYATQTWAQNQINLTANGIETKLSQTQTQLDGISIGGRNYFLNSSSFKITPQGVDKYDWTDLKISPSFLENKNRLKVNNIKISFTIYALKALPADFNGSMYFRNSPWYRQPFSYPKGTTDKKRIELTYSITDANYSVSEMFIRFMAKDTPDYQFMIENAKLEIGTTFTDWTPAPEDTATYTDTKVAELKVTVDGLSATFAKKTDLNTTASNLKLTADGLNLLTTATGKNGEKVTQVIADVNNIKSTMTGANGYTTRLQTLEGFQSTATNDLSSIKSQQTLLANQYTSIIGDLGNMVRGGDFEDQTIGQQSPYWGAGGAVVSTNYDRSSAVNTSATCLQITGLASGNRDVFNNDYFKVTQGKSYKGIFKVRWGNVNQNGAAILYAIEYDANKTYIKAVRIVNDTAGGTSGHNWKQLSGTYTPSTNCAYIQLDVTYNGALGTSQIWVDDIDFREDLASNSQITQLQGLIDQRVMVDGKIAAALSLSADGGGTVTIQGASLYVTAASHFDNASIKSAYIDSIDATKITSGSISADRLATTKLNADNITSGSISADRLATTKLNANNITSGSIATERLATTKLNANNITSGSIATERLATTKLNADNITSGSMNASLITAGSLNANRISGGTFNGANMDVININVNSLTGNKSNFVQSAWNGISSIATVNSTGMSFSHTDGSQTIISSSGLFHREGGSNYRTNYLMDFIRVKGLNNDSNDNPMWVQLPDIYKGKVFKAAVMISDMYGQINDASYNLLALNRVVAYASKLDYANGRVGLIGYGRFINVNTKDIKKFALQVTVIVSY